MSIHYVIEGAPRISSKLACGDVGGADAERHHEPTNRTLREFLSRSPIGRRGREAKADV